MDMLEAEPDTADPDAMQIGSCKETLPQTYADVAACVALKGGGSGLRKIDEVRPRRVEERSREITTSSVVPVRRDTFRAGARRTGGNSRKLARH